MARTVVIATRNRKKFEEMAALLGGLDLEVRSLADFPGVPTVLEEGETFEENAKAKALAYAQATGQWALADDSGLEVDALAGKPGVRSSRWGGEGLPQMNPLWLLKYLPNMPASHLAIYNDFRGPNNSMTLREASSRRII